MLPYWIGRVYLTDVESFRELGLGMIIGGVCLIPFCLFEIKMSPIMQPMLYGIGRCGGDAIWGLPPSGFL